MRGPVYFVFCCLSIISMASSSGSTVVAGDSPIEFDVPAMLSVHEIMPADTAPISPYKIIEVVVPVTSEIQANDRKHINEFRFDISWNQKLFPVVDYGPKSQTTSHIEGLIAVEQSHNSGGGISLNANSDKLEVLKLNSKADVSNQKNSRKSYQEIPEHQTLVASGTIKRGTGVFFRFHPSRTETLEGGREVVVAYRVARNWRGGVLRVECRANGQRKIFGNITEPIDAAEVFIVPVYTAGDQPSLTAATDFVRAEIDLKKSWYSSQTQNMLSTKPHSTFRWPLVESAMESFHLAGFSQGRAGASHQSNSSQIPKQWVHRLIQSGDERYLSRYQSALPTSVQTSAASFLSARQKLVEFSK
jgi:hypothetical protein